MAEIVAIHTSDRILRKRCLRKWDIQSPLRQNLEPIGFNPKLFLGSGVHYALANFYGKDRDLLGSFHKWVNKKVKEVEADSGSLWLEQRALIDEVVALGDGMLTGYLKWCQEEDPKYFTTVVATEQKFSVPIINPSGNKVRGNYEGHIDGVVKDQYGLYWLLEHKTASQVDLSKLPLDEQCGSYLWAAQKLYGLKLEGVIYNVLRKKLPTRPEPLKGGGLTKRANIDSTLDVYVDALIEHYGSKEAVPWNDYREILQTLKDKGNAFFIRERVRRSQKEIQETGLRIFYEYKDMTNAKQFIYPNPTRDCSWDCGCRSVCLAMNDGSDYQYLLNTTFRPRKEVDLLADIDE